MKELNIDKTMDTMIDLHMEEHVEVAVALRLRGGGVEG